MERRGGRDARKRLGRTGPTTSTPVPTSTVPASVAALPVAPTAASALAASMSIAEPATAPTAVSAVTSAVLSTVVPCQQDLSHPVDSAKFEGEQKSKKDKNETQNTWFQGQIR